MRMVMPVRVLGTPGPSADCLQAGLLIEGLDASHLIADKGYGTRCDFRTGTSTGHERRHPAKENRTVQRPYDEDLYKLHHLVEHAFLHPKR